MIGRQAMEMAAERTSEQRSNQDRVDEEVQTLAIHQIASGSSVRAASPHPFCPPRQVFKKAYIPRTLTEVSHYERDVDLMRDKEEESAISGHDDNVRTVACGLWRVNCHCVPLIL